jgi:hypothetical protein
MTLMCNAKLGRIEESVGMLDEEIDTLESGPRRLQLKQAQALLDLFEADYGRAPGTLEEIKEWAYAQHDEALQFRVTQLLK